VLFRQPLGESLPGIAAVLAAPDCGRATWTGASHRLKWHDVDCVGVVRVDDDREAEVGRQPLGDRAPGLAVVVAAQDADAWPRSAGSAPFAPTAVVLHIKPAGRVLVPG